MYALHANVKTLSDWRATNLRVTKTFKMREKTQRIFSVSREKKSGNGEVAPPKGEQLARSGYGLCESRDGLLCRHRVVVLVVYARRPMQRKTPWQVEPIKSKQATRSHKHTHTFASCFSIRHCIFLIALNKNGTRLNLYIYTFFSPFALFLSPISISFIFSINQKHTTTKIMENKERERRKKRRLVAAV